MQAEPLSGRLRIPPSQCSKCSPLPCLGLSEQARLKQNLVFRCSDDIRAGVSNLLVYVKSMKGLAGIRDAVWELLSSDSMSQNWAAVCRRLLDKPASFWEDLLQQLFLDRLEVGALLQQSLPPLAVSNSLLVPAALSV